MSIIRKKRRERQREEEPSSQVWIETPNGKRLVNTEDLDERGHLIEEVEDGISE